MSLQDYLKQKMREKGLTGKEIERRSNGGITDSYISKLIKGRTKKPSIPKLKALAKGLNVDENELFAAAGGELIEREAISAPTLVFIMQKLVNNSDLTTLVQILIKQKPAKIKALLRSLETENK
jgi:transcriptional regulator with XRE-family HTH domain